MNKADLINKCREKYYDPYIDTDLYLKKKEEVVAYIMAKGQAIKTIGEIGVLCGLGAYTLMRSAKATRYRGWDNESYNGSVPTSEAKSLLQDMSWVFDIRIADTQGLNTLDMPEAFDLFHVDGDHHPVACFHDMVLAHKSVREGGWILVDDYRNQMIQEAVGYWLHRYQDYVLASKHFEGATGNFLIQVKTYQEMDGLW